MYDTAILRVPDAERVSRGNILVHNYLVSQPHVSLSYIQDYTYTRYTQVLVTMVCVLTIYHMGLELGFFKTFK